MKLNVRFVIGLIPIFVVLKTVLATTTEVYEINDSTVTNHDNNLTYFETTKVENEISSPIVVRNDTANELGFKPHVIMDIFSGREDGKSYLICHVKFKFRRGYDGIEFKFVWTLNGREFRIKNTRFLQDRLDNMHKSLPPGRYSCIFEIGGHALANKDLKLKSEYGDDCVLDSDCVSESLNCLYGSCVCRRDFVHVITMGIYYNQCLKAKKIGERCLVDEQCRVAYYNSRCYYNSCAYLPRPTTHLPKEIYKAAVVALLCFVMMVASCLVFYLCNRSFVRRSNSNSLPIDDQFTNQIYNISDDLDARRLRLNDKPPAYQDIIARDQLIRGVPPPPYSEAMAAIHGVQRPIACLLVQPSTSTANSATTPTNGSNYEHIATRMAGPSTGIVNPNFISDN